MHEIINWEEKTGKDHSYDYNKLKRDLVKEFSLENISKKKIDKAYDLAWEYGDGEGSSRYYYLALRFEELVELMK